MALIDDSDKENLEWVDEIQYKPCKNCFSIDYDFGDCELTEDLIYEPKSCDQCFLGGVKSDKLKVH